MYEPKGCSKKTRITRFTCNGVKSPLVDVARLVGCEIPHYVDLVVDVAQNRIINLKFGRHRAENAGISNLQLFSTGSQPDVPAEDVNIVIDIDTTSNVPGTSLVMYSGDVDTSDVPLSVRNVFSTGVEGPDFSLSFDLPPGTYDVTLGFAETNVSNCVQSTRVFNVLINKNVKLESYDVFASALACNKAIMETFIRNTVDALEPLPLTISFRAVAGLALINYVHVKGSRDQCIPDTIAARATSDHLAHAIPGEYPPNGDASYVDRAGAGSVSVNVDGSGSHTHFFDNSVNGRIKTYLWTLAETEKVLSTKASFTRRFPLGTTRLKLSVLDNVCSRDEAETSITVSGNIQSGQYCYYYDNVDEMTSVAALQTEVHPYFGAVSPSLNLGFPNFPFKDSNFLAQCVFFLDFKTATQKTKVSVKSNGSGSVRVFKGGDLIVDSTTSTSSVATAFSAGLHAFEVIYRRNDLSKTPSLSVMIDGTVPSKPLHDQLTVLPIITKIDPGSGKIAGGGKTKIIGSGLYHPLTLHFSGSKVLVENSPAGSTSRQTFIFPPPVDDVQTVEFKVETSSGLLSNTLEYVYGSDCDPIAFDVLHLKDTNGENLDLNLPTSIATWQDGRLYIGTQNGVVRSIAYDVQSMTVTTICNSEIMTDMRYKDEKGDPSPRSILGITFDPRDKEPRPYITVSTLFWQRRNKIEATNEFPWFNGGVERLKPASRKLMKANPNQCLQFDRTIVKNLPVSDGDHSINELVFNQKGDLLIAVGSNTNAGLPFASLGGNWESYFSASIVVARLSRGTEYDGVIRYDNPMNLRMAKPIGGDIHLYATGFRNPFSLKMARDGSLYAVDMGPNCRHGNASSTCDEYIEADAVGRSSEDKTPFPGKADLGGFGECRFGDTRRDKLIRIHEGKFYGHPNLQRARLTNSPGECAWIDPDTGLSAAPALASPPANYEHRLATVKSAMTGLTEYGGNLFCGRMRNNLVMGQYKAFGIWRARLHNDGSLDGNPEKIFGKGGLRVEENVHGDLIFPKQNQPGVFVLRPRVSARRGLFISNALPWRHGRAGGSMLTIGGWGFKESAKVLVGGSDCPIVRRTSSEIVCKVPKYVGGKELRTVKVKQGIQVKLLLKAVLYMSV